MKFLGLRGHNMALCDAYTRLLESHHEVVVVIYENLTQKVMLLFMPVACINFLGMRLSQLPLLTEVQSLSYGFNHQIVFSSKA